MASMAEVTIEGIEDRLREERKKVDVTAVSFSARELVRMYASKELRIDPAYQRKYRWSKTVASIFIESLFLGLPIPPIFVATNTDFQWELVDGVQRVSTLIYFMPEDDESLKAIGKDGPLVLEGLEKIADLNGLSYGKLPKSLQWYFARQPIQVVALTDKSDKKVRYDLFERLNRGAIELTPQEVRNAVYRGDFMDFIEELSDYESFRLLLKLQNSNDKDGTRAEQVLKFFAYKNRQESFKGAVTSFLNDYAASTAKSFNYEEERVVFQKAADKLHSYVEGPFLRQGTSVTPLVQFEACLIGIARVIQNGDLVQDPPEGWLQDKELVSSSSGGTNSKSMLRRRLNRAEQLFSGDA